MRVKQEQENYTEPVRSEAWKSAKLWPVRHIPFTVSGKLSKS